jgi:hypothetical protein
MKGYELYIKGEKKIDFKYFDHILIDDYKFDFFEKNNSKCFLFFVNIKKNINYNLEILDFYFNDFLDFKDLILKYFK